MKKPDRGPEYRWDNGAVTLREIKRPDLVKDPYRVRGTYRKDDGRTGYFDAMNWREARDRAEAINQQIEDGHAARSKTPTFARVWREWIAMRDEEDLAPATRRNEKIMGRYLCGEFGKKPIDSIVPIDVELWLKRLRKSKPAIADLSKIVINQVFRFARRKRHLPFNPLADDPIKLPNREHKRPWVPGWEMMDRVVLRGHEPRPDPGGTGWSRLEWSNSKTGIALGAGAGLRISEVVALPWDRGPGDQEPCVDFANRVIQWVYEALLEHMYVLQSLGKPLQGPVIYNRLRPGRPVNRNHWNTRLYRFLGHAGIVETADWRFHVLRRFYTSARFALGHNEVAIREAIAHMSADVTFKHYARALSPPPPIWRYRFRDAEPDSRNQGDRWYRSHHRCRPSPAAASTGDRW